MNGQSTCSLHQIPVLLRGDASAIQGWIRDWELGRTAVHVLIIVLGAGLYGAAMGFWRDPWQAVYTAIKLPLLILITTFATALLNGMLAPLLGLNLRFRQSLLTVLTSFVIASVVLGAFSPILFFIAWNTPPVSNRALSGSAHSFLLLTEVAAIAFAGLAANLRLRQLLRRLSGSAEVAGRILLAWLATNLFLGSQVSWILRPFVGSPGLPVEFLRSDAFQGSFYEALFHAVKRLFFS